VADLPGVALRKMRKAHKLSQHQLAIRVGVTAPAVSQIENAKIKPRSDVIARMDDVLGAGGSLLRRFGYEPVNSPGGSVSLAQHLELAAEVDRLSALVEHLYRHLGVKAPRRRGASGSGA
jgi:transcriptional regulator with XRE-family HTH domain